MSLFVLNGWEATRQLKAAPAPAMIPSIALMAHGVATGRKSSLPVVNKVPAVRDPAAVKARVEGAYKWDGAAPLPHSEEMMALAGAGIFALHDPDRPFTVALRHAAASLVGRDGEASRETDQDRPSRESGG